MNEHTKNIFDGAAVVTAVSTLMAWLPPLAAALSIVWTAIRIYETRTFQAWVKRWKR